MTERKHAIHNPSSAGYWLHCGHWYHHKIAAEAAGEDWNPETDASKRGHMLHDVAEKALLAILQDPKLEDAWSVNDVEDATLAAWPRSEAERLEGAAEDFEQVVKAVTAAMEAIDFVVESDDDPSEIQVLLEQQVQLSHEPGSHGTVDIQIIGKSTYVVLDYKFGATPVDEDDDQFFCYAGNAASALTPRKDVYIGVIQPKLRDEALLHRTSWNELIEFRGHVNHVVREQLAGAVYAPASIGTCNYCPFKSRCAGHAQLVLGASKVIFDAMNDRDIEWVVANRTAITNGVETLAGVVKDNPDRFPDWSRKEVENKEKWNPAIEPGEIAHQLRLAGCKDPYVLADPSKIREDNPGLSTTVDKFVLARGSHIRLFRPKNAPDLHATIRTKELIKPEAKETPTPEAPAEAPKKRTRKTKKDKK